jgi:hypothetical protein
MVRIPSRLWRSDSMMAPWQRDASLFLTLRCCRPPARDKRRQTVLTEHWAAQSENAGVTFTSMVRHEGKSSLRLLTLTAHSIPAGQTQTRFGLRSRNFTTSSNRSCARRSKALTHCSGSAASLLRGSRTAPSTSIAARPASTSSWVAPPIPLARAQRSWNG